VEQFYSSVYEIFQRWVNRPKSVHTRRAYKEGVHSFVRYRGMLWQQEASRLLLVSVSEVQEYRDGLAETVEEAQPSDRLVYESLTRHLWMQSDRRHRFAPRPSCSRLVDLLEADYRAGPIGQPQVFFSGQQKLGCDAQGAPGHPLLSTGGTDTDGVFQRAAPKAGGLARENARIADQT
jgi:hypothetical protein